MLGRMSFAVVNPWSSQNEQASGDMSCISKANLQITVGVGVLACSGHPFTNLYILRCLHANFPAAKSAWQKTMGNKGRTKGAEGHRFQQRSVGPPETFREVHSQYGKWGPSQTWFCG